MIIKCSAILPMRASITSYSNTKGAILFTTMNGEAPITYATDPIVIKLER